MDIPDRAEPVETRRWEKRRLQIGSLCE
jgi:hypothetical protein